MSKFTWIGSIAAIGGIAVLVAAAGALAYTETASVTLSVQARVIEVHHIISGGTSNQPLKTTLLNAQVTESQQGTASLVPTAAQYASGVVLFTYECDTYPCTQIREVPQGFVVATPAGVRYLTQSKFAFVAPYQTVNATVRAELSGASGNTPANTVTTTPGNMLFLPKELKVTNPAPITGGADAGTIGRIQQSDIDTVSAALTARVTTELAAQLKDKASGMTYAETAPPTFTVSSDSAVGAYQPTFTVTVTGKATAVAFDPASPNDLLRNELQAQVPTGYALTTDPIQSTYEVKQVAANGDVTLEGSAKGAIVPMVSTGAVRQQIRGMSVSAAKSRLVAMVPGSTAQVRVSPSMMPFLPMRADRIDVRVVVLAPIK